MIRSEAKRIALDTALWLDHQHGVKLDDIAMMHLETAIRRFDSNDYEVFIPDLKDFDVIEDHPMTEDFEVTTYEELQTYLHKFDDYYFRPNITVHKRIGMYWMNDKGTESAAFKTLRALSENTDMGLE